MFDKVVVGIDDYEAGRDALELAKQLVSTGGDVLIVFVQVVVLAPGTDSDPPWQVTERQRAEERLLALRAEAHVHAQLLEVQALSVAAGLHEAARGHGDLLVIGASRRDELDRVVIGDDTHAMLKDPPCAVAVAPAGFATRAPVLRTIGVAYDDTPESERALAVARNLARECRAELSAFEAVREPVWVQDPWAPEREIEEAVAKARERLVDLGGLEPHAASGDAAEELARYAASVDLLVLGSHEQRPIDRLTGGSPSQRLADSVPCALLVLPSRAAARA